MNVLDVKKLNVTYDQKGIHLFKQTPVNYAVSNVSFSIEKGKTYGLVGESGSGKSTVAHSLIGLCPIASGEIVFNGQKLNRTRQDCVEINKDIQIIFQDAYGSLNPKKKVIDIISEPIVNYETKTFDQLVERVSELLEKVGMRDDVLYRYPHEFSGGERQRIAIARALALNPKLIIADEPTSSLDTSTQARILNYMKMIQQEMNISYLFISHDLSVVSYMADHIGVLYDGQLIEEQSAHQLFKSPKHDYTKTLIKSIPSID
ncbi:peptide/nickel transport system ATP-binding protein [Pelagirhabdus alkalitolerans]|uniref:Peptide/nickel transport system ATP-binding protein n=1 Tax=Pelagirhabdus alkalitolerans TaxID=1612202 RepID=A0A1G6MN05_9BACI|nr:ATP-binding cassette domain-containing protein [Pelagirhabdus alkalitolerans]SDC56386.1 peptide/nickel transport system ATP-binding protein [Pelagirhabdus alkalitolerans]